MKYNKPPLTFEEQVALLRARGLQVADPARSISFLRHVNYYRFSAYCLPFECQRHQFLPGVTFEQVEALYEFDRVLRDLVAEALELVEVDFRTAVAYHFGHQYGPFAHTSPFHFHASLNLAEWTSKLHEETSRSSETFVEHFRDTYEEYPNLPIWIATEVMSFGSLSQMYQGMLRDDQAAIAKRYGAHSEVLASWMHHLVYVRNLCAHHCRLWNRQFGVKPLLPKKVPAWQPPYLPGNDRVFCTLLILNRLMAVAPTTRAYAMGWRERVGNHLEQLQGPPHAKASMGYSGSGMAHPLWR